MDFMVRTSIQIFGLLGFGRGLCPCRAGLFAAVFVNGAGDEGGQAASEPFDLIADFDDLAELVNESDDAINLDSVQGAAPDGMEHLASELLKGSGAGSSARRRIQRQVRVSRKELGHRMERHAGAEGLAQGGLADLRDLQDVITDLEPAGLQGFPRLNPVKQGFAGDLGDLELALGAMGSGAMRNGNREQIVLGVLGAGDVLDSGKDSGGSDGLRIALHGLGSSYVMS